MKVASLIIASLLLFSCTESRSEKQTQSQRNNDAHLFGSVSLPLGEGGVFIPIPFDFNLTHSGTESQEEKGQSETKLNTAAIGQQLGGVVVEAIKTGFSGMTGIRLPESRAATGLTAGETGGAVATATALAYALQQTLERRNREKVLEQVKEARDEAQRQALKYAEKVDPNRMAKDMEHA